MNKLRQVGVIVAARMSSNRLPGKATKELLGIPMLSFLFKRLKSGDAEYEIILATSENEEDDVLEDLAVAEGVSVYRGDLNNVVQRYIRAANNNNIETVVRVTADCPFVSAELVNYCLKYTEKYKFDLATTKGLFPVGLDVEIYHNLAMEKLYVKGNLTDDELEHLTLYYYKNKSKFKILQIPPRAEWKDDKNIYTIDTKEDFIRAQSAVDRLGIINFTTSELVKSKLVKMQIIYSKKLSDINVETEGWLKQDSKLLKKQILDKNNQVADGLRTQCLLCGAGLSDALKISHRDVDYVSCNICQHIQSIEIIQSIDGENFDSIYPEIGTEAWESRCDRIYIPKLEWILNSLKRNIDPFQRVTELEWLEIGSGAGYFIGALKNIGVRRVRGIEANANLVARANAILGSQHIKHSTDVVREIQQTTANVIVGFFVLEHIDEPNEIIKALASKPPNTVLVFSVPTYGFSTILEAVFTEHAARNLDSVVHRQLYTDNSIDKFLELCGYDLADKWVFGQDALDFKRLLIKGMESIYDTEFADGISRKLTDLIDPLQGVIDTNLLSDARHIIAIKR